ncbi:hypothetical protein [Mycobacterium haemophilum]|uniref:Membrane protein n=1 Tax=Mycobacterium haemophilum TaxID=29311 RepID=A0A0I9YBH7_9MYCO|nr:hypothetical protein [Mycobacterium haemophilum]AKN17253.1 hypothetical protein B586_12865 [Mycobacterium haemophilum DSM 44634]KLO32923.1 membrane protein [Mycobacterium haemophilum]KLO37227.1 membrane protein [Mycobacterium haemophilum]KLO43700.1 membrane protein [Mycobacterium haemophilum]KLO56057.1 membrane protein [Mycobacterium haemophilum]
MAAPHQPQDPFPADDCNDQPARTLRLRVAVWDLTCTVALLTLLVVLATATDWPVRLFGFVTTVCPAGTCGPVPYGIDMWILPVVWGGIGAAIAAAGIGPFVSLLKGWYLSFWPVLSLTILIVSAVTGSLITTFSERYWL